MKVPERLKKNQLWFGGVVGQAMQMDRINPVAPSGRKIVDEAAEYIVPSPTLQPWERIQIYNQQYWWRLLKVLQENYPMVTRLFGHQDFNQGLAVPYLLKYPSNSWSIDHAGDRLAKWVEEAYHAEDKSLILDAVRVDFAFCDSFTVKDGIPLDISKTGGPDSMSEMLSKPIYLQPWIHLFQLPYDLFSFRHQLLKHDPDYWVSHDFPHLERDKERYCFIIYRTPNNNLAWDTLTYEEYSILSRFKVGGTIEEACEWLEQQDQTLCEEAAAHIHFWFQEWTLRQWLTLT